MVKQKTQHYTLAPYLLYDNRLNDSIYESQVICIQGTAVADPN